MLQTQELYEVIPTCANHGSLHIERYNNVAAHAFNPASSVYIFGEILHAVKGNTVTAKWYAQNVAGHAPGSLIGSSDISVEADGAYDISFCVQPPYGGWTSGEYRVEVYFNGKMAANHPFLVR
jgi:hypothetical protein